MNYYGRRGTTLYLVIPAANNGPRVKRARGGRVINSGVRSSLFPSARERASEIDKMNEYERMRKRKRKKKAYTSKQRIAQASK